MPLALGPVAPGLWAYILGKSLIPMLQLLLMACMHNGLIVYTNYALDNVTI